MSVAKFPSMAIPTTKSDEELGRMSRAEFEEPAYIQYPSWCRHIESIREPAAEFFGTMILVILGVGVNLQVGLSADPNVSPVPKGTELSINLGWATAVALPCWLVGAISGGHLNPALTLGLATWRDFPWRKVPAYIVAQVFGAMLGGAIVYGNYVHAINVAEGGSGIRTIKTANGIVTFPLDYMTNAACFFSELLATAIIFITVLSLSDKRNGTLPVGLGAAIIWIMVLGIGTSLGMETSYAVNPARDLGPRLFLAMVGYGSVVFNFRSQYWLWCPIISPILGAQLGGLLYDTFLFTAKLDCAPPPRPAPTHELTFDTHRTKPRRTAESRMDDLNQNVITISAL